MDDVTAAQMARGIIRSQMTLRGFTYAGLASALRARGVDENERNLRNKIARGTFSAMLFLQCLEAMDVDVLQLTMLFIAPEVRTKRITYEKIAPNIDPEGREELKEQIQEVQDVLDAGEKAKRGE